jgi:hypothetical protein
MPDVKLARSLSCLSQALTFFGAPSPDFPPVPSFKPPIVCDPPFELSELVLLTSRLFSGFRSDDGSDLEGAGGKFWDFARLSLANAWSLSNSTATTCNTVCWLVPGLFAASFLAVVFTLSEVEHVRKRRKQRSP